MDKGEADEENFEKEGIEWIRTILIGVLLAVFFERFSFQRTL